MNIKNSQIPPDLQVIPALMQRNGMSAFKVSDDSYWKGVTLPPPPQKIQSSEPQSFSAALREKWDWLKSYMNEQVPCPELEGLARTGAFCAAGPLGVAVFDSLRDKRA